MLLLGLTGESIEQGLPLTDAPGNGRADWLMATLDRINQTRGRGTVRYAGEGLRGRWRMRQKLKSAASTTGWAGVPGVR